MPARCSRRPILSSHVLGLAALTLSLTAPAAIAQHVSTAPGFEPRFARVTNIIVPQSRSFATHSSAPAITVQSVDASVEIVEVSARTTLDVTMKNNSSSQQEAVILIPVPAGSAISSFMFEGTASEPMVEVLRKDEARRVYDSIVAQVRDPALLEFAGHNLVRSSVFPVPANATQRVRITYEHLLEGNGDALSFVLPRSSAIDNRAPWTLSIDLRSKDPISTVYSPTHELLIKRMAANRIAIRLAPQAAVEPGPFRMFYLRDNGDLSATLMAYPDPTVGGGYFLLTAGLPADPASSRNSVKRDLTIVLDRSGSMAGKKMEQARHALALALESLQPGETFNIIDFGTSLRRFSPSPVVKNAQTISKALNYVQAIGANGGTNTFAALHDALREAPPAGSLPMVLFLTDGLPTIGRTTEPDLRALVEKGNAHHRRIYTIGVGHDVGAPLLDRIAEVTRGVAAYVQPEEDISVAVASTMRKLRGPVFTDLNIDVRHADKSPAPGVLADLQPVVIPDLFEGDHLVLLGRYASEQKVVLRLQGKYFGTPRAFDVSFDLASATTKNDFVPRLWATRRIAELIERIRQQAPYPATSGLSSDKMIAAIVEEIVELSTKFGILTEYTAFLAREGTNLSDVHNNIAGCWGNLEARAIQTRSGVSAVNQAMNYNLQKGQTVLNARNAYYDASMQQVEISNVQQVADRALFNRNGCWVDSRIAINAEESQQPTRTVTLGSPEHSALLDQLIEEGRQALIAVPGEVLLMVNGERVLVINVIPSN